MTIAVALAAAGSIGFQPSAPSPAAAFDVTLDNSYPTGGYPFDAGALVGSKLGLAVAPVNLSVVAEAVGGYRFEYDRAAKKLKVLGGSSSSGKLAYAALSAAGLAVGTGSAAKVKIANTVTYLFAGAFKSKTTAEVAFTATTHDIAADAVVVKERVYVLTLDGSGTATITAGPVATGAGNAAIPAPPANSTVIGYVRIAVGAGATSFTAATTLLSNGALTVTYVDATVLSSETAEVASGTDLSAIVARVTPFSN